MMVVLSVERSGASWFVKHNGGFLGAVATRREAERLAEDLRAWLGSVGRTAVVEPSGGEPDGLASRHAA